MRYAKYKSTGIAWLPEVPEGWECVPIKRLASIQTGSTPKTAIDAYWSEEEFDWYTPVDISQVSDTTHLLDGASRKVSNFAVTDGAVRKFGSGTVLMVCIGSLGRLAVSKSSCSCNQQINGIECGQRFDGYYAAYALLSQRGQIEAKAVYTTLPILNQTKTGQIVVPIPPLPTQRAIVAYLDEKCGKVDRLVVAKEKEAALLKELKQSMIAEAVTRGVRPKRRLVLSGIPWLPEVPEGWEVKRAKYLFQKEQRPVRAGDEIVTCFRDGEVTLRKNRRISGFTEATDYSHYQHICAGDLVIHQMDAFAGSCGVSDSDGMGTPVLSVCTPKNDRLDVRYFAAVVRLMGLNGFIQSLYRGIRERSSDFRFETFAKQVLPVPSLDEQREIVAHIEARAAKIDAAVKGLEREVAALKEYKQRLIADVVTGQRKVA